MSLVGFKAQNHEQQTARRGVRSNVDDRGTEPAFFDMLNRRFRFTVDVAALPHNAKLPRYFVPPDFPEHAGRCMWAQEGECGREGCKGCEHGGAGPLGRDGLAQSWAGERVWCNPPYSDLQRWVSKAHFSANAELIVMLLPANRTEQHWWQHFIEPYRDGRQINSDLRVEFLPGRMRFVAPGAQKLGSNERPPFGCCLVIWGDA
jgi:hypothetical protein